MSFVALQIAVRDRLRVNLLALDTDNDIFKTDKINGQVGMQREGMPPATAGTYYVGIHGQSWQPGDTAELDTGIDEIYGVNVTVTIRSSKVVRDRQIDELYANITLGLDRIIRWVMVSIHQDYTLITDANSKIDATGELMEPLRWEGNDAEPIIQGPDWFNAAQSERNISTGWSWTIRFGKARRIQSKATVE